MGRLLVHIATGPENPTRVGLGLLVARTALEAGHEVDLFFAGDAVAVMRPETLDAGHGIGTGSLREHVDALAAGGAHFYLSGMSSKARGISAESLAGLAGPDQSSSVASWAAFSRARWSARMGSVARAARTKGRVISPNTIGTPVAVPASPMIAP